MTAGAINFVPLVHLQRKSSLDYCPYWRLNLQLLVDWAVVALEMFDLLEAADEDHPNSERILGEEDSWVEPGVCGCAGRRFAGIESERDLWILVDGVV